MSSRGTGLKIKQVARHRNGVGGDPFYAILFECPEYGDMVASVFDLEGRREREAGWNGRVSVFQISKLAEGCVTFGLNSFRGDVYETELRRAIAAYEIEEDRKFNTDQRKDA